LLAGFIAVIHSVLEEYYWRWFVFGRLRRLIRPASAAALASLAFMGHHVVVLAVFIPGWERFFTLALPLAFGLGVGGAVWSWLYHRSGSIYAAWISHLIIDASIMAVGYEMVFGGS